MGLKQMEQQRLNGNWSIKDIVAHPMGWQTRVSASLLLPDAANPKRLHPGPLTGRPTMK
jgi:hypothetical protein